MFCSQLFSGVLCTRHAPVSGYYISLGHICLSTALSQDVNLHSLFLSSDVNIPFFLFCGAQLQVLMLTGSLFRHQSCPPCTPSTCSQRPLQREGIFYQFFCTGTLTGRGRQEQQPFIPFLAGCQSSICHSTPVQQVEPLLIALWLVLQASHVWETPMGEFVNCF